jgi:hypothetical protein
MNGWDRPNRSLGSPYTGIRGKERARWRWMDESTAGNARWKRGEQYMRDGTGSTPFDLESWRRHWPQTPAPRKVAYCTRPRVLDRMGWLPRKVRGEHGRIMISTREDRECRQAGKDDEEAPLGSSMSVVSSLPERRIPTTSQLYVKRIHSLY